MLNQSKLFFRVGGVLEPLNIPFYMATGSPCRIEEDRNYISQTAPSKAASADPSASLFKQGLGTYRKAFRDKHTPLLITPLFIFKPPRRHCQIHPNRTPCGTWSPLDQSSPSVVVVRDSTSMFRADFGVLRHYNNAAGSMAAVRGRHEHIGGAYRTEMPFQLSPHRHFDRNHTLRSEIRTKRR